MPDDRARRRVTFPLPGVPEELDEELTPPPVAVPEHPRASSGFDSIPPPIAAQLEQMHAAVSGNVEAVKTLWPMRHAHERISTLETKVDLLRTDIARLVESMDGFVKPAIKSSQGRLALLLDHHNQNLGRQEQFWTESWPRTMKGIDDLVGRMTRLERQQDRCDQELKTLLDRTVQESGSVSSRFAELDSIIAEHDARLRKLETSRAVDTAITKAEKRKTAGVAGAAAAAIAAIAHFFHF